MLAIMPHPERDALDTSIIPTGAAATTCWRRRAARCFSEFRRSGESHERARRGDHAEDSRQRGLHGADGVAAAGRRRCRASSAARFCVVDDDGGDATLAAARSKRNEAIFNPNKHRLTRCSDAREPRPGEVWIAEIGAHDETRASGRRDCRSDRRARSAGAARERRRTVGPASTALPLNNSATRTRRRFQGMHEPAVYDRDARLAFGAADPQRRARRRFQDARDRQSRHGALYRSFAFVDEVIGVDKYSDS